MHYVILFEDNDEFAAERTQLMNAHLSFLERNHPAIIAAGPLLEPESGTAAGGLWIVDVEDSAQVSELVEQDPFWPTGLRKSIRVLRWNRVYAEGARLVQSPPG